MSLGHDADTRIEREPERDDRVRIGPIAFPHHEWVASFVRWEYGGEFFYVDTFEEHSRRVRVKGECLRGLA